MSVIQTIRNKYIGIMIGAIVIALVGFLVMDAVQNKSGSLFSSDKNTIGSVNGESFSPQDFFDIQKKAEDNAKAKNPKISEEELSQAKDQAWDQMINEKLMTGEYEKLGITVGKKELQDMLTGTNPDPFIRQQFTDPQTGVFDPARVKQTIDQLQSAKDEKGRAGREQFAEIEKSLINQRMQQKYGALISLGTYIPKTALDFTFANRGATASIDYVAIPYTAVQDADIKITDEDIKAYEAKNPEMFTLKEEIRNADYVLYDIVPTADDSAKSLGVLFNLANDFSTTANIEEFVSKNGDEMFDKNFHSKGNFNSDREDSASSAAIGAVVGPYFENGSFKITKVLDKKTLPDSMKASHIFIAITQDLDEDAVDARADSIMGSIGKGGNFEQLASTYSNDDRSKANGGDIGWFMKGSGGVPEEFEEYCLTGAKGSIKKVKTNNGVHIVKITDQNAFKPMAKVATLVKKLNRSKETIDGVFSKVTAFASGVKTKADFDAAIKKQGLNKLVAENMFANQKFVQGIGSCRDLVRYAFDSKIGSVSNILSINGEKYVVASLSAVNPKGLAPVSLVRASVEADLRRNKKAAKIAEMYKTSTGSLATIAAKASTTVMSADTVTLGFASGAIANESRVLGASLNKANLNKVSSAIAGNQAVYYITVKNIVNNPSVMSPENYTQERAMLGNQMMQNLGRSLPEILKKKGNVVDNRASFN
jgi:peptidyl-prolyl cis-trans isomerase D